ncbi:hypothetical protein yc1106_04888 [Curvularia clavata]|uniref:Uncharacterized protein n=1 Tax=Curvularia clavata TaxID=95742 RepID=A0A9Q8ZA06_CURCL|nr:hypothetical protein yc1106_04888 [Curvularia clavata]
MHYAHAIILTIVLVTFFCCFFGWCLMKSCRRVIDAEMQEVAEQRELEAQVQRTVVSEGSSSAAKSKSATAKSKSSKMKSKASGKGSKASDSKEGSQKWGGGGVAKSRVQNMQPMMQQQIPMYWQAQDALHASSSVMHPEIPQQTSRQIAPRTSKPDHGLPGYQPQGLSQYHKPHEESVGPEASGAREQNFSVTGQSPMEHMSGARRVDYIHICDEYPPIVLEALNKVAPASPTASSSTLSSSSSNGSGTTQEIPRTSIGYATPDYVTSSSIQFPRYCRFATDARDLS